MYNTNSPPQYHKHKDRDNKKTEGDDDEAVEQVFVRGHITRDLGQGGKRTKLDRQVKGLFLSLIHSCAHNNNNDDEI